MKITLVIDDIVMTHNQTRWLTRHKYPENI